MVPFLFRFTRADMIGSRIIGWEAFCATERWRHGWLEAPKTYQDLLDPRWKGKMAWNPGSMAGAIGFVGSTLMGMGEERGRAYLEALSRQQVVNIEASSRAILDQVIAGEYPMGLMMFNHHTVISAQKGAPSDWLGLGAGPG